MFWPSCYDYHMPFSIPLSTSAIPTHHTHHHYVYPPWTNKGPFHSGLIEVSWMKGTQQQRPKSPAIPAPDMHVTHSAYTPPRRLSRNSNVPQWGIYPPFHALSCSATRVCSKLLNQTVLVVLAIIIVSWMNQNTQEVKYERFLNVDRAKTTDGLTDIKHDTAETFRSWDASSLEKIREEASQFDPSTVTLS